MGKFATYSLQDVQCTMAYNKNVSCVLSNGGGQISLSRSGDLSSHTTTATGNVTINKMRSVAGSVTIEVPQNSDEDRFLREWIEWVKKEPSTSFAETQIDIWDPLFPGGKGNGRMYTCKGVTPTKEPDLQYGQTSASRQYTMLTAEIVEDYKA